MQEKVQYVGEHLWAGQLGTFFISLSFASAFVSIFSYYLTHKNPGEKKYRLYSRLFFSVHAVSIFTVIGTLFFMMINHYFEYAYAWKHTDLQLEPRYLFAAFWEDQEGSFLLWAFWHAVIGIALMFSAGKWEAPVMLTLSLVQVWLCTMVMGIYVGDHNIGTNPFILMRDHPQFSNIPLFSASTKQNGIQVVDYISKLSATARGMNPLLKNYWMTIHPPTLFFGFSLTVVPFCYSIAGLLTGNHKEWQRAALPWTFLGVMILGTGILMGGAWAYEALSFGGFWAWDPVENASFVPWLTLVGAAHLMLVNNVRGTSYFSTYLFSVTTFVLVLYSTFLTRSGILGDSSVHAFTDLGMERLLIYFVIIFILFPVTLLLDNRKISFFNLAYSFSLRWTYLLFSFASIVLAEIFGGRSLVYSGWIALTIALVFVQYFSSWANDSGDEESAWSREFWIFIGSVILFILAISISAVTSFPVINRIFKTNFVVKDNGMNLYNLLGMIFGIFILLLMAFSQFLKYKKTQQPKLFRKTAFSIIASLSVTAIAIAFYFSEESWNRSSYFQRSSFFVAPIFLLFSAYTFFSNFEYLLRILNGKIKNAGASIAHAGFAMVMIGCVISNSGKQVISQNSSGKDISALGSKFSNNSNILLQKGDTLKMGDYYVAYAGKKKEGINILYQVDYFEKKGNIFSPAFTLYPRVQLNKMMGNAAEPGTQHFLTRDIYTDVTYAELSENNSANEGWSDPEKNVIHLHDSIITNDYIIILDEIKTSLTEEQYKNQDSLLIISAVFTVKDEKGNIQVMKPTYIIRNSEVSLQESTDENFGIKLVLSDIDPDTGTFTVMSSSLISKQKDFIVMEALVFPWINILWTGCVIMVIGIFIAVLNRIQLLRRNNNNEKQ